MTRAFLLFLVAAATAIGAEKVSSEYQLTPSEKVVVQYPERFRYDVAKDPDDAFRPSIRLRAFDSNNVSTLSFKVFPGRDAEVRLVGQKEIDEALAKISASYVAGSVEKTNAPQHLRPENGLGAYCSLTDAELAGVTKLPLGQFRYITFAVLKIDNYVFSVRGYSNSKDDGNYKAILSVLEGLKVEKKRSETPKGTL
jgi:hypothetical protein